MSSPKVTIFTPTYNRAYILPELYKSLKRQKCNDFEWIIIDDGSKDNTKTIVNNWQKRANNFQIIYKKVKNGGKHRAINKGALLANSPLFFIVDSDDYIVDDAIETILNMTKSLPENCSSFAGVAGTRISPDSSTIGQSGSQSSRYIDATNLEREEKKLTGDKAEVYFTEVLKKHPFPCIEGENFLSEEIVWDEIAREGLKIRWFNQPLIVCEYREDGLSKNLQQINIKNPRGFALYIKNKLLKTRGIFARLRVLYSYYLPMHTIQSSKEIRESLNISQFKLFQLQLLRFLKRG